MELKWVDALREHGQAYQWLKDDLERQKAVYQDDLNRVNPDAPYKVAAFQAQIRTIEDLQFLITTQERKDTDHAGRQATLERRAAAGRIRRTTAV